MIMRAACAAMTASFMFASPARADDTPVAWDKAVVYLPRSSEATTVDRIPADRKLPAIIYMHGCSGLLGGESGDNHPWARLLAAQGLLVVMPNSMARGDRKPSCDPATNKANLFPPVYGMRLAEIKYAAEQIRAQPWFNGKLLLMGHSEGGMAAARSPLPGFAGVIVSGWTCTNAKFRSFDGVFAPPGTPVLTIQYNDDPWYPPASVAHGHCEPKLAGRANATAILLPGRGHGTYNNETARKAVMKFVAEHIGS
jgi:dienelactone hydrolase